VDEPPVSGDPLARTLVLGVACGRVAIGLGAFFATRRALAALGFSEPSGAAVALARLAGGRDIALGLHALAVRDDPAALKQAAAIGAAVDAGDAIASGPLSRPGTASTAPPRSTRHSARAPRSRASGACAAYKPPGPAAQSPA
jgi:hypothetical protein